MRGNAQCLSSLAGVFLKSIHWLGASVSVTTQPSNAYIQSSLGL